MLWYILFLSSFRSLWYFVFSFFLKVEMAFFYGFVVSILALWVYCSLPQNPVILTTIFVFFISSFLHVYSPFSSSPSLLVLTFSCVFSCTLFSISLLLTTFRLNLFLSSWMKRAMPSLFRPLLSSLNLKVSVRKIKWMLTVQIISMLLNQEKCMKMRCMKMRNRSVQYRKVSYNMIQ